MWGKTDSTVSRKIAFHLTNLGCITDNRKFSCGLTKNKSQQYSLGTALSGPQTKSGMH